MMAQKLYLNIPVDIQSLASYEATEEGPVPGQDKYFRLNRELTGVMNRFENLPLDQEADESLDQVSQASSHHIFHLERSYNIWKVDEKFDFFCFYAVSVQY